MIAAQHLVVKGGRCYIAYYPSMARALHSEAYMYSTVETRSSFVHIKTFLNTSL